MFCISVFCFVFQYFVLYFSILFCISVFCLVFQYSLSHMTLFCDMYISMFCISVLWVLYFLILYFALCDLQFSIFLFYLSIRLVFQYYLNFISVFCALYFNNWCYAFLPYLVSQYLRFFILYRDTLCFALQYRVYCNPVICALYSINPYSLLQYSELCISILPVLYFSVLYFASCLKKICKLGYAALILFSEGLLYYCILNYVPEYIMILYPTTTMKTYNLMWWPYNKCIKLAHACAVSQGGK